MIFASIFSSYSNWGLFILRLAAGIIGWPKLNPNSPMKGPAGFGGSLKQMGVPIPIFFGWVVSLLKTVGAVLLILGLGTRIGVQPRVVQASTVTTGGGTKPRNLIYQN